MSPELISRPLDSYVQSNIQNCLSDITSKSIYCNWTYNLLLSPPKKNSEQNTIYILAYIHTYLPDTSQHPLLQGMVSPWITWLVLASFLVNQDINSASTVSSSIILNSGETAVTFKGGVPMLWIIWPREWIQKINNKQGNATAREAHCEKAQNDLKLRWWRKGSHITLLKKNEYSSRRNNKCNGPEVDMSFTCPRN